MRKREMNGKPIELLAPAGTLDIFKTIVQAPCDAVYLGGSMFNMRMIRKGYNLSREQLKEAVELAHSLDKKVYVTVNNLIGPQELEQLGDYLGYLDRIGVDAIIVQDFAVVSFVRELGLRLPIHASVMMNAHNTDMVLALQELGVTRTVVSREMDLKTAQLLHLKTGMELEYFVHGDMCSVHGANCLASSFLYGMSSNRGRCMKPCRWAYRIKKDGEVYPTEYPLAAKDMYMYEHIPELIEANVTSFKLEGRMRDVEAVRMIVEAYGDAIDRYLADPVGFNRVHDADKLYENRKRDYSTAYAFGKPGLDNINRRYEGTGVFYSTGKVFSTPTAERELTPAKVAEVADVLQTVERPAEGRPRLTVRVNNKAQASMAIAEGVDVVYLSGEVFLPDQPFTKADIEQLAAEKGDTQLVLGMPRMMTDLHMEQYGHLLENGELALDGLLVTHIGAARTFAPFGYPMVGDFNLNLYNQRAEQVYAEYGVERLTASLELHRDKLAELLKHTERTTEMIVHGSPVVMYMEHDLYENTQVLQPIAEESNRYVDDSVLVLMTDKGESPVYRDHHGRNHLTIAKELCYLPLVPQLLEAGVTHYRIEGCTYDVEQLRTIIRAYRQVLADPTTAGDVMATMKPVYAGYTLGTLDFAIEGGVSAHEEPAMAARGGAADA
ncbi:peptidase U32 [Paenibacillus sp. 598K]|uniref:peptidase U32 family protein n=1 Tax=Paenibacillus sp. 598K TaxID=1117987 RepID=UPI000FF96AB7|nr:U32 family peptidase [Paenibacillus sp. 598K]GBF76462.1 peptidase U32 [Paenibacillus sp. 598K]